jgi:hypothetical protein
MKLNLKTLAAAAALAMTSLASHAAITSLANPTLLLVAYDSTFTSANSYYRNLGTLNQLNTTSFAFNAPTTGSIFTQQLGAVAAADIGWTIIALDNTAGAQTLYTAAHQAGVTTASSTNVQNVASFSVGSFGAFGALDSTSNTYANANGEYTGNLAYAPIGAQTNAADVISAWTGGTLDVGLGIGDNLNLFKTTAGSQSQLYTSDTGSAFGSGSVAGGYFTLLAGGNVTWTNPAASVSAVPVPGAALLFGPGLLAVLAAARRRKEA